MKTRELPPSVSLPSVCEKFKGPFLTLIFLLMWVMVFSDDSLMAKTKVPDLTKGDKPTPMRKSTKILAGNLGPTGMMGWVYEDRGNTSLSRQILVTEVSKASPADGVVRVGDVILGSSGKEAKPKKFSQDARRSFADSITDAEASSPANLNLLIWRNGKVETKTLKLRSLGAYAESAPYNCPKSKKIIEQALVHLKKKEPKIDRFGLKILALLACDAENIPGRKERLKQAKEWVLELFPKGDSFKSMISDKVETYSKVAWNRTYHLITLSEYYLATGDNPKKGKLDLLTLIDAHAQSVARGQSMFGTMGHQFAMQGEDGAIHGPYGVGYGPINATGLAALLGLSLARDCKLPNPKTRKMIEEGIERASTFFRSYVGRGTIPYGEHPPWTKSHCSNGKSGLAALAFSRIPGDQDAAQYFSKVALAAGSERIGGHGGGFFNYLWSPLGANAGGPLAGQAYFKEVRWHLELSRTWDGGFYYNDYGSPGYHGPSFKKASLYMSTPVLLTYAMGFRKLNLTGKGWSKENSISKQDVNSAELAGQYRPSERSEAELIEDLNNFSALVKTKAAEKLSEDAENQVRFKKLTKLAENASHPSRVGIIRTLGLMGNEKVAPLIIRLLKDDNPEVREAAVEAFGNMPKEIQVKQVDVLLKMAASLKRPPMEVNGEDPVNTELITLTTMLFEKKGLLGEGLAPVVKYSSNQQLHEAIRAVATLPSGGMRGKLKFVFEHLSKSDVKALGDTLLELIYVEAPGDAMFAEGIRSACVKLLLKHRFEEGVKASLDLFKVGGRWTKVVMINEWKALGSNVKGLKEGPEILSALEQYKDSKFMDKAKDALAAIGKSKKSPIRFSPLK